MKKLILVVSIVVCVFSVSATNSIDAAAAKSLVALAGGGGESGTVNAAGGGGGAFVTVGDLNGGIDVAFGNGSVDYNNFAGGGDSLTEASVSSSYGRGGANRGGSPYVLGGAFLPNNNGYVMQSVFHFERLKDDYDSSNPTNKMLGLAPITTGTKPAWLNVVLLEQGSDSQEFTPTLQSAGKPAAGGDGGDISITVSDVMLNNVYLHAGHGGADATADAAGGKGGDLTFVGGKITLTGNLGIGAGFGFSNTGANLGGNTTVDINELIIQNDLKLNAVVDKDGKLIFADAMSATTPVTGKSMTFCDTNTASMDIEIDKLVVKSDSVLWLNEIYPDANFAINNYSFEGGTLNYLISFPNSNNKDFCSFDGDTLFIPKEANITGVYTLVQSTKCGMSGNVTLKTDDDRIIGWKIYYGDIDGAISILGDGRAVKISPTSVTDLTGMEVSFNLASASYSYPITGTYAIQAIFPNSSATTPLTPATGVSDGVGASALLMAAGLVTLVILNKKRKLNMQ